MQKILSLQEAISVLDSIEVGRQGITDIFKKFTIDADTCRAHCFWDKEHYTRNLIRRNPEYELLILCWGPGQVSPIHNHEKQDCWMYVVSGSFEEKRFDFEKNKLRYRDSFFLEEGKFSFINDDIGLHRICNAKEKPGITLHLYSKPIDYCNVYSEEATVIERKTLKYDSIHGKPA